MVLVGYIPGTRGVFDNSVDVKVVASSVKVGNIVLITVVFSTFGVTFSVEEMFIGTGVDCLGSVVPDTLVLTSVQTFLVLAAVGVFRSTTMDSVVIPAVTTAVLRHESITPTCGEMHDIV